MTILQSRNNNTASQIEAVNTQLIQMQQMIAQMQSEMRVLSQQHKAQETLAKEWDTTQKTIVKQFKDACSVYGSPEAIDDMIADITTAGEEVKANFDDHAQSDRFLNQETAQVEDEHLEVASNVIALPVAIETLPDEADDTTILSSKQVEQIFETLSDETVKQLQVMFNVSMKLSKRTSIAQAIAKANITFYKLSRLIVNIEGQQSLLAGL
jgi:hypothetical protein